MGKTRAGVRSEVVDIVRELGKEAFEEVGGDNREDKQAAIVEMVRDAAKKRGIIYEQGDVTMAQYVQAARSELGWTKARKKRAGGGSKPTPTKTENPRSNSGLGDTVEATATIKLLVEAHGVDFVKRMADLFG